MVAQVVWRRLGDVANYVEPFCGSSAVLLARPPDHTKTLETINDVDAYVANFWRAIRAAPEAVVDAGIDWPVNEADLEARHKWLVTAARKREHEHRMRDDPDYYDVRIAAYWCYGLCAWIGSGWCEGEWHGRGHDETRGRGINTRTGKVPYLTHFGSGVHKKRPQFGDSSRGVHRKELPGIESAIGECADRRAALLAWMNRLADRLRRVRVCCGDWQRVCGSYSTTTACGTCGVFLDPPYSVRANRAKKIYRKDSLSIAHRVRKWCIKHGSNPEMRIALCGYDGESHADLEQRGWTVHSWSAHGGYAKLWNKTDGLANRHRERIWFSPACLPDTDAEATLF